MQGNGINITSGPYSLGGFLGKNAGASENMNLFSTGFVNCPENFGGFLGNDEGWNDVKNNCFWDTETSGLTIGASNLFPDPSGLTGKTTTEMNTLSTFTNSGWDFIGETANGTDDFWDIDGSTNDGYAFLMLPEPPLSNPGNLTLNFSSAPELTWDPVSGAVSYTVYYSEDPYAEFPAGWTSVSGITETNWTDPDQSSAKKFYIVVAVN